tara:strand:- start:441 stop:644 length:204 start_codon:yes stop_codon:yes gene_type:complete
MYQIMQKLLPIKNIFMIVLYTEMKVKNMSKYLLMKTMAYSSCVFNETPAQDLVASIFNRRTYISYED